MTDSDSQPRKRVWEVMPLYKTEINESIVRAEKTPEDTDLNAELKRMKIEEVREMIDRAKTLEITKVIEERRLDIEELRDKRKKMKQPEAKEDDEEESPKTKPAQISNIPDFTPDMIYKVSQLPDEQKAAFFDTLNRVKAAGASNNSLEALIAPMAMYASQNKSSSVKDYMEFAEKLQGLINGRDGNKSGNSDSVAMFKAAVDLAKDAYKQNEGANQPQHPLGILGDPGTIATLKDMFGGNEPKIREVGGPSSLELLKEERAYELEKAKLEIDKKMQEKKIDAEVSKADSWGKIINSVATAAVQAVNDSTNEGGPRGMMDPRKGGAPGAVVTAQCPVCKAPIHVSNPKEGQTIVCMNCKNESTWFDESKGSNPKPPSPSQ